VISAPVSATMDCVPDGTGQHRIVNRRYYLNVRIPKPLFGAVIAVFYARVRHGRGG
jgi:hypothetical protein